MYLGWFDDDRKKASKLKIEEAIDRYVSKFGSKPTLCLVNVIDNTPIDGIEVKVASYVRPNHFWVGQSDKMAA